MVTFDGTRFMEKKDNGLVANIFDKSSIDSLQGRAGSATSATPPRAV